MFRLPFLHEDTSADREWGTDSLRRTYERDTPYSTETPGEQVSPEDPESFRAEAWEKNPNCQQCRKKLSTTELKRGDRICAACVKKNKGRVWGNDKDDMYTETTLPSFKTWLSENERITLDGGDGMMSEVTPPGMESWVKSNKKRFKKEYGGRGEQILYAKAWDLYHSGKSEAAKDVRLDDED